MKVFNFHKYLAAPWHEQQNSIRRYLHNSIRLILIGGVLLLGVGITFFVYQTEASSWRDREDEAAQSAAKTIDLFLEVVRNNIALASQIDDAYLQEHPETFKSLLQQTPALLEIIHLDSNGHLLCGTYQDSPIIANLFTFPQSNWFHEARSGRAYLGDVQISANGEPYLLMAIPTSDGGVVAARLRMNVLWDEVSEIHFGDTGQTYIVNDRGEIIAHPDSSVVLNRTSLVNTMEFATIQQARGNSWHGTYTNFAGTRVVSSTTAIPNTSWIIVTEISQKEAFATTTSAFFILGGLVIIFGLLIMLLMINLMQRTILTPIETLRSGADRIGQGSLEYRIAIHQQDEIGQVAEAFNEMAARLSDREVALKQARDEALQASQFKSRLLANVGHDLRTPINSILGYAEIMSEGVYGPLNEMQHKANERILSNARRLINLINSLLDQAQIEAGKLVLRPDVYNPAELLTAVRETMEIPAQSKGLLLTTESAEDVPPWLVGDYQRTQQMIMNLVENALKFTTRGSVCVRLYVPDSTHWAIDVSDTGTGIAPEASQSIFEPFHQVDTSTTRSRKGIGLGLSIVKQIALLMEGDVSLQSEIGKGCTFTILLPLIRSMPDE